jgi:anthranilate phosphoribosyltransferase
VALLVDEKVNSIEDGIEMAKDAINNGSAIKKLDEIIEISNSLWVG